MLGDTELLYTSRLLTKRLWLLIPGKMTNFSSVFFFRFSPAMRARASSIGHGRDWGPFLESPGDFSGPKSKIQIEIKRIRARFLARKRIHFVSLTDSFIMLDAKLLKPLSCMQTTTALRAR